MPIGSRKTETQRQCERKISNPSKEGVCDRSLVTRRVFTVCRKTVLASSNGFASKQKLGLFLSNRFLSSSIFMIETYDSTRHKKDPSFFS